MFDLPHFLTKRDAWSGSFDSLFGRPPPLLVPVHLPSSCLSTSPPCKERVPSPPLLYSYSDGLPHVTLIELRVALISYQDYHML